MSRFQPGTFWKLAFQMTLWRKQQIYCHIQKARKTWGFQNYKHLKCNKVLKFLLLSLLLGFFILEIYIVNLKNKFKKRQEKGNKSSEIAKFQLDKTCTCLEHDAYFDNHIGIFDWLYNMLCLIVVCIAMSQLSLLIVREPWFHSVIYQTDLIHSIVPWMSLILCCYSSC